MVGGGTELNDTTKRLYESQIKTLQNAPRDVDKLERLLKVKQREKQEVTCIEDTERLATEIEMLKVVLYYLVNRNRGVMLRFKQSMCCRMFCRVGANNEYWH